MTKEEASALLSNRILVKHLDKGMPEGITVEELSTMSIPSGTIVSNSCFSCETPDSSVFPKGMKGVRFFNCNLDNVVLPPGNPEIGENQNCSNKRFKMNPDEEKKRDWEIDDKGDFVRPI